MWAGNCHFVLGSGATHQAYSSGRRDSSAIRETTRKLPMFVLMQEQTATSPPRLITQRLRTFPPLTRVPRSSIGNEAVTRGVRHCTNGHRRISLMKEYIQRLLQRQTSAMIPCLYTHGAAESSAPFALKFLDIVGLQTFRFIGCRYSP